MSNNRGRDWDNSGGTVGGVSLAARDTYDLNDVQGWGFGGGVRRAYVRGVNF